MFFFIVVSFFMVNLFVVGYDLLHILVVQFSSSVENLRYSCLS